MTRNLILFSSVTLGAFACSDADKGPGYATPVLSCKVEGMSQCETRVYVSANPGGPPYVEFGAYDLDGPIDSAFGILFSTSNDDSPYSNIKNLKGEIVLNDYDSGMIPRAEFNINTSGDDIMVWNSQESTIHAVYDEETRTLEVEWNLELEQIHPMVDPRPIIRAKGESVSPVYVECWKPIDLRTSILDGNFETEYCKPWKEFHTPARFPDL